MGGPGRIHDHPTIGRLAVCAWGKIGRVEVVSGGTDGRLTYLGSRVTDNTKWQSTKPVFLNMEESALVGNALSPEDKVE